DQPRRAQLDGVDAGSRRASRHLAPTHRSRDLHTGRLSRMSEGVAHATTTGKRTKPPFRADHVGSLLRPPRLLHPRDDFSAGRLDAAELRAIEDAAIHAIVRRQEEVGLQSATDGEFRRASWHM